MSKVQEETIKGYLEQIQQVTLEKEDLQKQLEMWGRKHKDSEWKLNNLLE